MPTRVCTRTILIMFLLVILLPFNRAEAKTVTPPKAWTTGAMKYSHLTRAQARAAWNNPKRRSRTVYAMSVTRGAAHGLAVPKNKRVAVARATRTATAKWRGAYAWDQYTFYSWPHNRAWFKTRLDYLYNGHTVAQPVVTTSHHTYAFWGTAMGTYSGVIDKQGGYRAYHGYAHGEYLAKRTGHWGAYNGGGFNITAWVIGHSNATYTAGGSHD